MFEPGALVDKYRILKKLGHGGMGMVFAAEHVVLQRRAAIKVLHPQAAENAEIIQRFINEAIAAAALASRNIVGVHDCGQLPGGQWFLALEYLDGESLASYIERHRGQPIALPLILRILAEAGAGLHAAHTHGSGIVHRDIKPENLFLAVVEDPALGFRVVVLDFGIAKLGELAGGLKTRDNAVMGTPPYMAPEQLHDSGAVDPRSDVYALGCIAFEMATGRLPWGDEFRPPALYHLQLTLPTPDPSAYRADLPRAWVIAVMRALAADRRERWPSVSAFLQALAHATPRTEWADGMELLHRFAPDLTTLTEDDKTIGRKLPSALGGSRSAGSLPPGAVPIITHTPLTVSDGIPRGARPGQVAVTTAGAASGQSVAPSSPTGPRRALWLAAASVAAVGGITAVVLATQGGDDAARPAAVADAGAPAEAAPRTTALAIVTEPSGAGVFVDGEFKGRAPVNVAMPVGAEVEIRAELAGHVATSQGLRVGEVPEAVRLTLAPVAVVVPDAAPAAAPAPVEASEPGTTRKRERPRRPSRTPPTTGSGSTGTTGSGTFNPDDAGGD